MTRVYTCGARLIDGAERVSDQISLAHKYYNQLIAIEHRRREMIGQAQHALDSGLDLGDVIDAANIDSALPRDALRRAQAFLASAGDRAWAQVAALTDGPVAIAHRAVESASLAVADVTTRINAVASAARSTAAELKAERKVAKQALADARAHIREVKRRANADPGVLALFTYVRTLTEQLRRDARASCGVYWGTYLIVEAAVDAARKSVTPPAFRHWQHGSGRVAVQLQGGLLLADTDTDTRLQFDVPDGSRRGVVRLRVGSEGRAPVWATWRRAPVWATWRVMIHSPIPPGRIMWATIIRRHTHYTKSGIPRFTDKLQLTLDVDEAFVDPRRVTTQRKAAVAIDLGWRRTPAGLRVATCHDGERTWFIHVDRQVEQGLAYANAIRSTRDTILDALRPKLTSWFDAHRSDLPTAIAERVAHMHAWKSFGRFAALYVPWSRNRFAGDSDGFELLMSWQCGECNGLPRETHPPQCPRSHGDAHLAELESRVRTKALNRRRDAYRCLGAELAQQYETIVLEALDLSTLAKRAEPGDKQLPDAACSNRFVAAPGEYRSALLLTSASRGTTIAYTPAKNTTARCHSCGSLEVWDHSELMHRCSQCSSEWDQDDNAARNMLREHCSGAQTAVGARSVDGDSEKTTPKPRGRFARAKAK